MRIIGFEIAFIAFSGGRELLVRSFFFIFLIGEQCLFEDILRRTKRWLCFDENFGLGWIEGERVFFGVFVFKI